MDRLQAMQAFVAVVEAGSFTAAADTLGRSKSQISKQVSALEQSLGLQLLQRSTRQLAGSPVRLCMRESATMDHLDR